uniref:Uncharacterized protein n=1 Tax=mine drainage metagenome TaxID=410659 RepID=E6QM31_9ZZZZ
MADFESAAFNRALPPLREMKPSVYLHFIIQGIVLPNRWFMMARSPAPLYQTTSDDSNSVVQMQPGNIPTRKNLLFRDSREKSYVTRIPVNHSNP